MLHSADSIPGPSMSPIALRDGFGLLHQGDGPARCGVVLCSPWGVHELSARKVLFRLATRLAAAGMPTLRFDYPGTADAADRPVDSFGSWVDMAGDAAGRLRTVLGLEKVVFAGIGIGATIALLASAGLAEVEALVLAAPVISGRRYLREIALGAPVVEEGLGLGADQRPAGVSIGGIVMPPAVADELKSVDLAKMDPGAPKPVLLVERPSQLQDTGLADQLVGHGWTVDRTVFDGYDAAMDNPTIAVMPDTVIGAIETWIDATVPASAARPLKMPRTVPLLLEATYGTDEPLTFGQGLFGVLTRPKTRTAASMVVFLNSGYDHHAGWAYQSARMAGAFAAGGIPSLRFDMANIGDSAARPGVAEQVLYGDGQQADIAAAIEMLAARGETSIVLVGRCSGAFAAFHAAARDTRITATIAINPLRLIWDADEDVDVAIRVGPRSMADYRQRALSGKIFKRLLAGDVDVLGVAKGLGIQLVRRIVRSVAPIMGEFSKTTRLRRQCHAKMQAICRHGATIHFVCSERDASLEQIAFYFGGDYRQLKDFLGAELTIVPDADHNMTPQAAHDTVAELIRDTVLRQQPTSTVTPSNVAQKLEVAEQIRA